VKPKRIGADDRPLAPTSPTGSRWRSRLLSMIADSSSGVSLRPQHRLRGHRGCGHWLTGSTRTERRRTAMLRRARQQWLHSPRAGGENDCHHLHMTSYTWLAGPNATGPIEAPRVHQLSRRRDLGVNSSRTAVCRVSVAQFVMWVRSRKIDGSNYAAPAAIDAGYSSFGSELKTQWPFGGLHLSRTALRRAGASHYHRR
jgi:hypothetical protein